MEVTKIYSIAGLLPKEKPLIKQRQFRSPYHTSSEAALIGGGRPPRPGETTLAYRGVLFLDEFPEFHRDVLESLRQPIEEGKVTISRSKYSLTLPARFTLVAASNPCPCGYFQDLERNCVCTNSQIQRERFKSEKTNSEINLPQIKKYCQVDMTSQSIFKKYVDSRRLSARGYHRVLKVARTIADLEGRKYPLPARFRSINVYNKGRLVFNMLGFRKSV